MSKGSRKDGTNPRATATNPRALRKEAAGAVVGNRQKPDAPKREKPQPEPKPVKKSVRIAITKSVRFEVFKRDRFTCQYCGAKAPDVVLHADHIRPVADGGDNSIINLVTACEACNLGKGARKLDDSSAVVRQRAQIEALETRREQLEMMLQWRDAAEQEKTDAVQAIANRIVDRGALAPNESGMQSIRQWLKRYSVPELLKALDESFDANMKWSGDEPIMSAWEIAFAKIPVLASYARRSADRPWLGKVAYVQGILRRRFNQPKFRCMDAIEDWLLKHPGPGNWGIETIEAEAKLATDWDDYSQRLWDALARLDEELGRDDGED